MPVIRSCVEALGMHNSLILDSAVTASSSFDANTLAPGVGRLHYLMAGSGTFGSWAAAVLNPYQWLQADMGNLTRITGVATQGRQDLDEWVETYRLSTSFGEFFEYIRNQRGTKKVRFQQIVIKFVDYLIFKSERL